METLSTLKYANRARDIKNKVIQNQDSASRQIKELRDKLRNCNIELNEWRTGKRLMCEDGMEGLNDIFEENKMLQKDNENMRKKLNANKFTIEDQKKRLIQMQGDMVVSSNLGGGDNNE